MQPWLLATPGIHFLWSEILRKGDPVTTLLSLPSKRGRWKLAPSWERYPRHTLLQGGVRNPSGLRLMKLLAFCETCWNNKGNEGSLLSGTSSEGMEKGRILKMGEVMMKYAAHLVLSRWATNRVVHLGTIHKWRFQNRSSWNLCLLLHHMNFIKPSTSHYFLLCRYCFGPTPSPHSGRHIWMSLSQQHARLWVWAPIIRTAAAAHTAHIKCVFIAHVKHCPCLHIMSSVSF